MKKIISIVLLFVIAFFTIGTTVFATNGSIASGSVNESTSTSDEKISTDADINDATMIQKHVAGSADYFEY